MADERGSRQGQGTPEEDPQGTAPHGCTTGAGSDGTKDRQQYERDHEEQGQDHRPGRQGRCQHREDGPRGKGEGRGAGGLDGARLRHFRQSQLIAGVAAQGVVLHELGGHLPRQIFVEAALYVDVGEFQQFHFGVLAQFPGLDGQIGSLGIGLGTDRNVLPGRHGKGASSQGGDTGKHQLLRAHATCRNTGEERRRREQAIVGTEDAGAQPAYLLVVVMFVVLVVHGFLPAHTAGIEGGALRFGRHDETLPERLSYQFRRLWTLGPAHCGARLWPSLCAPRAITMAGLEDWVGNTPLCLLQRLHRPGRVRVFAKLEGNNPAGSVKDRAATHMIRRALERGRIVPGTRLIEPTSGNTGIALAMAASIRGLPITLIMPENMSIERRQVMRAFGADILLTPAAQGMEGAIERARAMVAAGEGVMLDQFSNPDNPEAHYLSTGPEIWRDTRGSVTHFVSAMGTTGTIMGTSRYLREVRPDICIVGVQPREGSQIPGIRRWPAAYLPAIYDASRVDRILDVGQDEAEEMTRRLAREEGILAGISSGGAMVAALRVAAELDAGTIVSIVCDRGDRYLSTGVFPA